MPVALSPFITITSLLPFTMLIKRVFFSLKKKKKLREKIVVNEMVPQWRINKQFAAEIEYNILWRWCGRWQCFGWTLL